MTLWMLTTLTAQAGDCGELLEAESLRLMVRQLQGRHLFIAFEASHEQVPPFTIRLAEDATALTAAQSAVDACQGCPGRYAVTQVGDRVDIRLLDVEPDSYSLLDSTVSLAPGERLLTDVAAEIEAQLPPSGPRIHRVDSQANRNRRVHVPEAPARSVRSWLDSLEVVPSRPPLEGVPGPDERLTWFGGRAPDGPKRSLDLWFVDLHVPDSEQEDADDEPLGFASKSEYLEASIADLRADPTPGMIEDPAYHAESIAILEQMLDKAHDFERRAAEPCDP